MLIPRLIFLPAALFLARMPGKRLQTVPKRRIFLVFPQIARHKMYALMLSV